MVLEQVVTLERELQSAKTGLEQAQKRLRAAIVSNSGVAEAKTEADACRANVELLEQTILGLKEAKADEQAVIVQKDTQANRDNRLQDIECLHTTALKGMRLFASVDTWVKSFLVSTDAVSAGGVSEATQMTFASRLRAARILELQAMVLKSGNPSIPPMLQTMLDQFVCGLPTKEQVK
jgi:hypothetical protein